jgi:hypothetical protein
MQVSEHIVLFNFMQKATPFNPMLKTAPRIHAMSIRKCISSSPSATPDAMFFYSRFSSLIPPSGDAAELVGNSSAPFEPSISSVGEAAELVATELVAISSALFHASTAAASDQLCIPVLITS